MPSTIMPVLWLQVVDALGGTTPLASVRKSWSLSSRALAYQALPVFLKLPVSSRLLPSTLTIGSAERSNASFALDDGELVASLDWMCRGLSTLLRGASNE